jgi:hypothetical protein
MGCEEDFFPELEPADTQIVVDAWINNLPQKQTIYITETLPYYENKFAPGIENATVFLTDNEGNRFDFNDSGISGNYEWIPSAGEPVLGKIGNTYQLQIIINGLEISSVSTLNRVPEIDSVVFRYEEGNSFLPQSYFGSFFARDIVGRGDTYWIKAFKNKQYLSKPNEINIAFDAAIGIGSSADGINFIQPIRDGINPFETDEDDNFLSPYSPGDSVFVELHSITIEAYTFLSELRIQTDRPGGFAELFATPLANLPTNLVRSDKLPVLGFFCMSAISSKGEYLDPDNLPK